LSRFLRSLSEHLPLVALLTAYTAVLTGIKLWMHERLALIEWDLAIYDQALWQIVHLRTPSTSVLGIPKFVDHFDPIIYLLAPAYALHPHPGWLLFYQALFASLAGAGIYAVTLILLRQAPDGRAWDPRWPALGTACAFLFNPSTLNVVLFLYHSEIIAMALLAWTFWAVHRGAGPAPLAGAALLAGLCKEDALVPFAALGLYLAVFDRPRRRLGLSLLASSLILMVMLAAVVHALGAGQHHLVSRYGNWGSTPTEMLAGLTHPDRVAAHLGKWLGTDLKLLFLLLGPTAGLILWCPQTALVWIPVLAQHLLSDYPSQHSIRYQYLTLALPGLYYSVAVGLSRVTRARRSWLAALLAATLLGLFAVGPVSHGRWLERYPYLPEFRRLLDRIPPDGAVAAPSWMVSHLSRRQVLRTLNGRDLPEVWSELEVILSDVDWILADVSDLVHPQPESLEGLALRDMVGDPDYGIVAREGPLVLLRRGAPQPEGLALLPPDWMASPGRTEPATRALLMLRGGLVESAWEAINQALEEKPRQAGLHVLRGQIARQAGRPEEARASFRRALELPGLDPGLRRELELMLGPAAPAP